jgi:hypothetical protein
LRALDLSGARADTPLVEAAHLPWRPLGRLLVEQGLLREDELELALAKQASTGGRLGEAIVELGFVSRPALTRALADQYGIELTIEKGFGTGLRAEIERRHDREREGEIGPPPQTSDNAPALGLVPEPEEPEPDAADDENLHLPQLEEQWAKLAAAEERLAEAERELTVLRRTARHRRDQAKRLVVRVRKRDRRITDLSAIEERLAEAERELTTLRGAARHRRDQAKRFVKRIRKRDRRIADLSAIEERLTEAERELTALRTAARHRREQAERLVERIRKRDRRIADLSAPPPQLDAGGSRGHVVYAQLAGGYALVERDGEPPEPDVILELPEISEEKLLVFRVGKSPLPNDARPCVIAQQLSYSHD